MTVHREQSVKREKENQRDSTIRCLLLTCVSTCFGHHYDHLQENQDRITAFGVLFCNKRENVDIKRDVFFVGYCVVNLVGTSCVYANVVCKWVCRGIGLVSASYVFSSDVSGAGVLMHALCLFDGRSVCGAPHIPPIKFKII